MRREERRQKRRGRGERRGRREGERRKEEERQEKEKDFTLLWIGSPLFSKRYLLITISSNYVDENMTYLGERREERIER